MPLFKLSVDFFKLFANRAQIHRLPNAMSSINLPSNTRSIFMVAGRQPENTTLVGEHNTTVDAAKNIIKEGGPDFSRTGQNSGSSDRWTTVRRPGHYLIKNDPAALASYGKTAASIAQEAESLSTPPNVTSIKYFISENAQPSQQEVPVRQIGRDFYKQFDENPPHEVLLRDVKDPPDQEPRQKMLTERAKTGDIEYFIVASPDVLTPAQPGQEFEGIPKIFAHDEEATEKYRAVVYAECNPVTKQETGNLFLVSARQHELAGKRTADRMEGAITTGKIVKFSVPDEQEQARETSPSLDDKKTHEGPKKGR